MAFFCLRNPTTIDITLSKAQLSRDEIIQLIGEKKNKRLTYSDIDTLLANGLELGSGRRYWATAGFLYSNDVEDSIFSASFGFGYLFPNIPLNMNLGIRNISLTEVNSDEEYTKSSSYLELELRSGAYGYYLLKGIDEIKAYRFGLPELGIQGGPRLDGGPGYHLALRASVTVVFVGLLLEYGTFYLDSKQKQIDYWGLSVGLSF